MVKILVVAKTVGYVIAFVTCKQELYLKKFEKIFDGHSGIDT
jgi:hypothetical protein